MTSLSDVRLPMALNSTLRRGSNENASVTRYNLSLLLLLVSLPIAQCCCWIMEVLLLTRGLVRVDLLGDPGRDPDRLPCSEDRAETGIEVEYDGGGCKRGVTKERHDTKRASKDYHNKI